MMIVTELSDGRNTQPVETPHIIQIGVDVMRFLQFGHSLFHHVGIDLNHSPVDDIHTMIGVHKVE